MPSTWSRSSSGCGLRLVPCGGMAWKPALIAGTTSMKMISRTSMTSIIGVTFGSAFTVAPVPVDIAIRRFSRAYCEIGDDPAVEAVVLNSRVKRDRPNSPLTFLIM